MKTMKNKGHKSSNIFQTLKSAGAWQTKDGTQPVVKNVGSFSKARGGSPLNLNQTAGKHYLSKGSTGSAGDSPLNLAGGILGYGIAKAAVKKGKELVGKAKQGIADYKAGKKSEANYEKKKALEVAAGESGIMMKKSMSKMKDKDSMAKMYGKKNIRRWTTYCLQT